MAKYSRSEGVGVRILPLLAAILLCATGSYFIFNAFHKQPENIPNISSEEIATPKQTAVGPREAQVKDGAKEEKMSPEKMAPNRIFIPSINVYAPIDEKSGQISQRKLVLPEASKVTRWHGGSQVTTPTGNLLIAGHVSWNGEPGALYNLAKAPLGAQAWVTDVKGNRQQFQLERKTPYKKEALPKSLWTNKGPKKLVVVTCGGKLHLRGNTWHFDSNIVAAWKPIALNSPTK